MNECIHGLDEVTCTICNGRDKREAQAAAETPRVFMAKYAGHCDGCNLPIHAGQWIAWREGHHAVHEQCAS